MTMNSPETIAAMKRAAKKYHQAGVRALGRDRAEDAVRALRFSVELDPALDVAWNDLGVVMEALGNEQEAARCYKRALTVRARFVEARTNLGMLMLKRELASVLQRQALTSSAAAG